MYISAQYNKYEDKTVVWERVDGKRISKNFKSPYYFYTQDENGTYNSIYNKPLIKHTFEDKSSFEEGCRLYDDKYESDIHVMDKVLMDNYYNADIPNIHTAFIDIECETNPEMGFAGSKNPYAPINAITCYFTNTKEYVTVALKPNGYTKDLPDDLKDVIIASSEKELLNIFLDMIEDVDLISGWNSEFFDLPYIGKRIELVIGESKLKNLTFPNSAKPQWKEVKKFKDSNTTDLTLDIKARIHLDYMKLFKKFNLESKESYSLAAIADEELDIPKIKYDGTLVELYNNDFDKFIRYNIRDVEIIVELDKKFRYIELANRMVHESTVNFDSIFGSVKLIDTAIINFGRHVKSMITPDRIEKQKVQVEGAVVMSPKPGLYKWVCTVDINSLYPSVYRSLNLSPEKIVGQFENYEQDWNKLYEYRLGKTDGSDFLKFTIEHTNEVIEKSVSDFNLIMNKNKWACSGYGTVLDQGNGMGLIPSVLSSWFSSRKELQTKKKEFAKISRDILSASIDIGDLKL